MVVALHSRIHKYCSFSIYAECSKLYLRRRYSLCSTKDPDLESALARNRRWIVNNQIKNIILRCTDQVAPVDFLQKKFKNLHLQGKALNWLKKHPCCYEVYSENYQYFCRLTKRMKLLVEEEESVKDSQEPVFVERLAKLLMMSTNRRLNVMKVNELKRSFGFPDDYLLRIVPKYSDMFRVVNYSGKRSSMEIQLMSWNPEFAVSALERLAKKEDREPCFSCSLPPTWEKSFERFQEFNSTPYISPYTENGFTEGSTEMDKRTVGLVHELLSLTLWKRVSIVKLGHLKREFCLPDKLNVLLVSHPGIFYVSNKYQNYNVVLREGYNGSKLIEKDPLVVVKEKFGELMQQGLYGYDRRHHLMNVEKKSKKGMVAPKPERRNSDCDEVSKQDDSRGDLGGIFDPEERKRFYNILLNDDPK